MFMKVRPASLVAIAIVLATAVAYGEGVLQAPVNTGFEDWTDQGPVGWTLNDHPDLAGTWSRSDQPRTRKAALTLHAGAKNQCHAYQRWFPANNETFLTVSVWLKGRGNGGLMLYTYDSNRVFNGSWEGKSVKLTDEYQPLAIVYVPDKPEVGHVAVVLRCEGPGAEATFDDLEVKTTPLSDLAGKYGYLPDLAAEAKQWEAMAGAGIDVAEGPYDKPALMGHPAQVATVAKPYDPATWWQASAGGGAGGPVWREFDSPRFPLLGGFPYRVQFSHRAVSGSQVHFKLRYYDETGAEVKWLQNTWAYHAVGGPRSGSWPWRQVTVTVAPVPQVRQARFEIWYAEGSGPIALADLSIEPVAVMATPSDSLTPSSFQDAPLQDARPVALPAPPTRKPVRFTIPAAARTRIVKATPGELSLELSSGIVMRGLFDGDNFLGIGEVGLGDLVLHAAEAPPWAPLPAADYERCRLLSAQLGCPGHTDGVTLSLELVPAQGEPDQTAWFVWPEKTRLTDLDGTGFGYSFAVTSSTRAFSAVTDRTVWGLAGTSTGLTVQTAQLYDINNLFPLGGEQTNAGGGNLRFVHADALDFQTGPEGSLITYLERPDFVDKNTFGCPWGVSVTDRFRLFANKEVQTAPKHVLFTPARGFDAFVAAYDYVAGVCRKAYDIQRQTPLPMVNVSRLQYDPKPESKTELQRIAAEWVPEFQKLGFRRIYLGPLWEGIPCGPSRLEIAERFGGEAALKTLCDAAHAHQMQVIEWLCPAHMWWEGDILKQHPEREIKGVNGQPPTGYCWPTLRGMDLTGDQWQYWIDSVRGIRQRTGLDGLWLDSYCSFTHFITTPDPEFPLRQGDALFRLHRELHRLGMVTYVEGNAVYGIKSVGLPCAHDDQGQPVFPAPETSYDTSPYYGPASAQDEVMYAQYLGSGDHYYRYLANKCCPFIYYERMQEVPGALERVAAANRDYNAVVQYMERRLLLPEGHGVLWLYQGKPRVLFAFTAGNVALPGVVTATEVRSGRNIACSGRLRLSPATTYLLQAR